MRQNQSAFMATSFRKNYNFLPVYESELNARNLFVAHKCGYQKNSRTLVKMMLSPSQAKVYLDLVDLVGTCGENGAIHTNNDEISSRTGVYSTQVSTDIRVMCEAGYITRRPVEQNNRWGFNLFITGDKRIDQDDVVLKRWYLRRFKVEVPHLTPRPIAGKALREALSSPRRWRQAAAKTKTWASGRLPSGGGTMRPRFATTLANRVGTRSTVSTSGKRTFETGEYPTAFYLSDDGQYGHRKQRLGRDILWEARNKAARAKRNSASGSSSRNSSSYSSVRPTTSGSYSYPIPTPTPKKADTVHSYGLEDRDTTTETSKPAHGITWRETLMPVAKRPSLAERAREARELEAKEARLAAWRERTPLRVTKYDPYVAPIASDDDELPGREDPDFI